MNSEIVQNYIKRESWNYLNAIPIQILGYSHPTLPDRFATRVNDWNSLAMQWISYYLPLDLEHRPQHFVHQHLPGQVHHQVQSTCSWLWAANNANMFFVCCRQFVEPALGFWVFQLGNLSLNRDVSKSSRRTQGWYSDYFIQLSS